MAPYDPPDAFYTEVPIPPYVNLFKLIGKGGNHLKYITEQSGCQYIWVDIRRRVVEIWGRERKLGNGIAMIKSRIRKITFVWTPGEYTDLYDNELKMRITVSCWEEGSRIMYDITGSEADTKLFFEEICKVFPFNPYMTQVVKKSQNGIMVARFSSCD
jgi:hypothetical protein